MTGGAEATLRVGILSAIQELDPQRVQDIATGMVLEQVVEPPFAQPDVEQRPVPLLFEGQLESRRQPDGSARYVGTIRRGLLVSDGSPLTAEDVATSLERATALPADLRVSWEGDRVHLDLPRPWPGLEAALSRPWCGVTAVRDGARLGTAAYRVAAGGTASQVRLERNPHARERAAIAEITFEALTPDVLAARLDEGSLDFTSMLSRAQAGRVQGMRKLFNPGNSTAILAFNTQRAPLSDRATRVALAQAIDRTALAGICYEHPQAFAARGLLPPAMRAGRTDLRHDPDAAREVLKQAGLSRKLQMMMIWGPRPYLRKPNEVATRIVKMLEDVGVGVELVPTRDPAHHLELERAGNYDLGLTGWLSDSPDPADFLEANLASRSIATEGQEVSATANNAARWASSEFDDGLRAYRHEPSRERLDEILTLVHREVPLLPLMYGPNVVVHTWKLRNFEMTAQGLPRFAPCEFG